MPWRHNFNQRATLLQCLLFARSTAITNHYYLYVVALVLATLVFVIRISIAPSDSGVQYVAVFPAVALAAILGGFRAGLLTALFWSFLATYFLWPSFQTITFDFGEHVILSNVAFLIDAALVCGLVEAMHQSYYRLGAENENLRLAVNAIESTSDGIMVMDYRGRILAVNTAFSEITGYCELEVVDNPPQLLRSDRQAQNFYEGMWRDLNNFGFWQGELWNRKKNGEIYLEFLTINKISSANDEGTRCIGVFQDVTELRRKDDRIHHLAYHDSLTDLPNRLLIRDRTERALAWCHQNNDRAALVFVDLDRFRNVNDEFGHTAGDLLLVEVAERIKKCVRSTDTVARLGGDQFVILLESLLKTENCSYFAQDIIAAISQPIVLSGKEIQIGTSLGIAFFPDDAKDWEELMKHAGAAMFAAKSAERNVFRYFQQGMLDGVKQRLTLEAELRRGIDAGELVLYYQPKIELASGRTAAVEALVRWNHPKRGLMLPNDFIAVAEESNLIVPLGDWVLCEAVRQLSKWVEQGFALKIAINVTARQLETGDLARRIQKLLSDHEVEGRLFEIEVTESMFMKNTEKVVSVLQKLREIGVSIAIDDFGTGYSSLAYLRMLPLDVLKIDRSFVINSDENEQDAHIVKTIVALGHALNLTVVAEGVEKAAHVEQLRLFGCERGQGYYFSKPLPAEQLEAWL